MPNPVQFDVTAGALPEGLDTDPQGLLEAFASRLLISPSVPWSSFVLGAAQPTSDLGPWFKNGNELYVWDNGLATYVPQVMGAAALKYYVGAADPGAASYLVWFDTTASSVKVSNGATWTALYTDRPTTTAMNTAITNAVNAVAINYPCGVALTTDQTVSVAGAATFTKLLFNSVTMDPDSAWDTANSQFVAPVDGIYLVGCELQIDNGTGVAASMEFALSAYKNSGPYTTSGMAIASPPGGRWFPQVNSLVELAATDVLDFRLSAEDGTNTGNVVVASGGSTVSVILVRRL